MIEEHLLKEFNGFESRSHSFYKDFYDRIKDDRNFLSGEHFDESDKKRFGNSRLKMPVDIISNTIRSIVNQYSSSPFSWNTSNSELNELRKSIS